MLPLKIDEHRMRPPFVTIILILICTILFFTQYFSIKTNGLVPLNLFHSLLHPEEGLTSSAIIVISSFFLHGGIMHLLGNMWYLWLFGSALESHIGAIKFIFIYLLSGIFSMFIQAVMDPFSTIPIVGASGAIAGIMGMHLILKPFAKLLIWLPPIFIFRIYSFFYLIVWFWFQWINSGTKEQNGNLIAWGAHIGGFLWGVSCAFLLRKSTGRKRTG